MADLLNLPLMSTAVDTATPLNNYITNVQNDRGVNLAQQLTRSDIAMQPAKLAQLQAQTGLVGAETQNQQQSLVKAQWDHMNEVSQTNAAAAIKLAAMIKPALDTGDIGTVTAIAKSAAKDPVFGPAANDLLQQINSGNSAAVKGVVDAHVTAGQTLGILPNQNVVVPQGGSVVNRQGQTINNGFSNLDMSNGAPPATTLSPAPVPASTPATGPQGEAPAMAPATGAPPAVTPPAIPQQGATPSKEGSLQAPALQNVVAGPRNDAAIQNLPPAIQTVIKGLTSYTLDPKDITVRYPQFAMQIFNAAQQYSPTYTQNGYDTVKYFNTGDGGTNLKSLETAINTLAMARDASDKLGGSSGDGILTSTANSYDNWSNSKSNSPELNTYLNYAKNGADETSNAVLGVGNSNVSDRETRFDNFRSAQSPEARTASLQAAGQELMARLGPVASQFNRGTNGNATGGDLLSPATQAAFQKLMAPVAAPASGAAPKGITATNTMGHRVISTDGGKTWQPIQK